MEEEDIGKEEFSEEDGAIEFCDNKLILVLSNTQPGGF